MRRYLKTLREIGRENLTEFIRERVSIRIFIHLRDARTPKTEIDMVVERDISQFIRGGQVYLNIFTTDG